MAESGQPLAGIANHNLAISSKFNGGYSAAIIDSGVVVRAEKVHLGGSIAVGILVGAVAAFLLGGLVGVHQEGTGTLLVGQTTIVQQSAP